MVSEFQTVCSNLNIITVGLIGPKNFSENLVWREGFAVSHDIRRRVLYDPTAEFAGGVSGGGQMSYYFSRLRSQHVAGLVEMAGWLAVLNTDYYRATNRVQTNLLVARTTGLSDGGSLFYLPLDSNYLASCGAVIRDWYFNGGHTAAPNATKTECLQWLLDQRVKPGPTDKIDSENLTANWRSRMANGERETVLHECVATLMSQPRTWNAFQAELMLDEFEADFNSFRSLNLEGLAQGNYALDMFLYSALATGDLGDGIKYQSSMRGITGVTPALNDRNRLIHDLLTKYHYASPVLQYSSDPNAGSLGLVVRKDVPGLSYTLQTRSNLTNGSWTSATATSVETGTTWSAALNYPTGNNTAFFRVSTGIINDTNEVPTIVTQPSTRTNYAGTEADFVVDARGTGPFTYQWRKNGVFLSDGGSVSGSSGTVLILANTSQNDGASYDVLVSGYGVVTSRVAVLSVTSDQSPPSIVSQPQSRTNNAGTTGTFMVSATSAGPLTYHWQKDGADLFDDNQRVFGSETPALTLSPVALSDAGSYDVVVNGYSSVTSDAALLTVNPSIETNHLILYEPFNYTSVGSAVSANTPANWTFGGTGANDLNVASGSLSHPADSLRASVGNSVTNGGNGLGTRRLFGASVNSGVIYFSALIRINDLGYGVWNGAASQVGALTATDNTSFRLQVVVERNPTDYNIGVQKGGTGSIATWDPTPILAGDTVFLVGRYDFNPSPNNVRLWVNPDPANFGVPTSPVDGFVEATSGTDGFTIDRFNMRQNTAATVPPNIQWDELRVGTSWADVTPKP